MGLETETTNYVVGEKRSWAVIKYSGTYNLQEILSKVTDWLGKRNYFIIGEEHTEKVSGAGNELKVITKGSRKVSWYVRFGIQIDIEVVRNIDVLIEKEQGKEKTQHGELEVRIKAAIDKNYKNTFKNTSKFQETLRRVYERFIIPGVLRNYRKKLAQEADDLIEEIKRILGESHERE